MTFYPLEKNMKTLLVKLKVLDTSSLCDWTSAGPAQGWTLVTWLSCCSGCKERESHPGSSWKVSRMQDPDPATPVFPEALRTVTVLLFCSPEEKISPHIFFQSTCKTKNLRSNALSQVKTFQDLRNAHSLKTIFLTCNLVSYPWF